MCFCFLDRAVCFINARKLLPYWFLHNKIKNDDDIAYDDDEYFILERRTSNDNFIFKETIVCSCLVCFRFQVSISSEENFLCLSNVDCRFVKKDLNVFDDTYNDDIFVGDHQFVVARYFKSKKELDEITDEKIVFLKRLLHKSYFTSLRKNVTDIFVQAVKKFITNFSKKSYMFFLELTSYGSNVNNKKRKYTVLILC